MCMCYENECNCGKTGKITKVLSQVKFDFSKPYSCGSAKVYKDYLNEQPNGNYERSSTVITKYGMVLVQELRWEHDFGWDNFSVFTAVVNGEIYRAYCKITKLSEWQLKHKAQQFYKVINQTINLTPNP